MTIHRRHRFNLWIRKIPLEEGIATHSSILAWKIPWTEEPSGLQSIASQRVRHDWSTHTCAMYYHKFRYIEMTERILKSI